MLRIVGTDSFSGTNATDVTYRTYDSPRIDYAINLTGWDVCQVRGGRGYWNCGPVSSEIFDVV